MDISGIVQTVFNEFDRNKNSPQSVAFENHIYGLLVMYQGLSGEVLQDLSDVWLRAGIEYGFYENERALYEGSHEYKDTWTRVFQDASCCDPDFVEAVQDALFAPLCLRGAVFFAAALNTGELPICLALHADDLFPEEEHVVVNVEPATVATAATVATVATVPMGTIPVKDVPATIRYRYTRGRVRSPIVGQRKFSRTRKVAHKV